MFDRIYRDPLFWLLVVATGAALGWFLPGRWWS